MQNTKPCRAVWIAAFLFILLAAVQPAAAQQKIESLGLTFTATPAIANDYLFRGISQTRNNWAFQGTFDLQHDSGVYVGAFISNATFLAAPTNTTRQELDLLAGYRFEWRGLNVDLGGIAYLYPGQTKPAGTQLNEYYELAAKLSYTIEPVKLLGAFNYSPNFFGRSGAGFYIEAGADVTLPYAVTGSARLGHQWIQRNTAADGYRYFGTPDYLWYSISASREIYGGVTASVGWYGTTINKRECIPVTDRATGGQRICDGRVLFTLSRVF